MASTISSYAATCSEDSITESGEVDFIKALDITTSSNEGSETVGSLTTEGETDHVGTAEINNDGAAHGANKSGVRFKIDSKLSADNNKGTVEEPDIHLINYQIVTYSFSEGVNFSDSVILKDLDGSNSGDKYIDAATILYEDMDGNIIAPKATLVGEDLITFDTSIEAQPSSVTLPSKVTGYAPPKYKGVNNSNEKYWVTWDLSDVTIKKIIILYWDNEPSDDANGAQGISFESPLSFDLCPEPTPAPSISLIKSISSVEDVNKNDIVDAGDIIHYNFKVTNTGNVELKDISISDEKVTVSGSLDSLDVEASDTDTFSATYTITQDDVDAGGVENRATVNAQDDEGTKVSDISDTGTDIELKTIDDPESTETESPLGVYDNNSSDTTDDPTTLKIDFVPAPSISLIKSISSVEDVNKNKIVDAGDIIHYNFEVTNSGNVELKDISISDDIVTVNGSLASLDVNKTDKDTFSATYTITQDDVDAGGVENRATVNAQDDYGTKVSDISDTGTDPQVVKVTNPESTETESPLEINNNDVSDPTDDPTTLKIDIVTAHIGDLFWIDKNHNGIKDEDEDVVAGATVELFDNSGNPISDVNGNHSVVTDENGIYGFDVIAGETYILRFTLPDEYIAKDYEFISDSTESSTFELKVTPTAGKNDLTLDAPIACGYSDAPIHANNGDSLSLYTVFAMLLMFLSLGTLTLNREETKK
jgi:hypothetical protein